ncbi:MAG: hypothetical protein VYC34_10435 [Planctomycetota bacterium]|nr:hypothetical protein [Planctomycetota bacterium]
MPLIPPKTAKQAFVRPLRLAAALFFAIALAAPAAADLVFLESRIDVVAGRTMVAPVAIEGDPRLIVEQELGAVLSDGREIPANLVWISIGPDAAGADVWLTPYPAFATHAQPPAVGAARAGFWVVICRLPPNAAGLGLRIAGEEVPIAWIAPPRRLFPPSVKAEPRPEQAAIDVDLARRLLRWGRHPATRWRINLLGERLSMFSTEGGLAAARLTNPTLQALAEQTEDRWRAALARLAQTDPPTALRILETLTRLAWYPDVERQEGVLAPMWPVDQNPTRQLLTDLLDPHITSREVVLRAKDWLANQPMAATWVIDDVGRRLPGMGYVVTMGVANLTGADQLATLKEPARKALESPVKGPPVALVAMRAGAVVATIRSIDPAPDLSIELGDRLLDAPKILPPLEARPPGAILGPLLSTWTQQSLLDAAPTPARGDAATAALLQKSAQDKRWRLYVECRMPPQTDEAPSPDSVRIHIGPSHAARAVLHVNRMGFVIDETDAFGAPRAIEIAQEADRWSFVIEIEESMIERDRTLLVGLVRDDALGRRSSWPRPLLPWASTPGRAQVDLGAWQDLTPEEDFDGR